MEYDNYIIGDENLKAVIYPLMKINANEKEYLIYTIDIKNIESSVYVGEINGDKLMPIKEELISSFDEYIKKIINEYKKLNMEDL